MTLTLSSEDLTRLNSLQETLLSPLEHRTVEDWCMAVLRHAEELFQADRSALMLPVAGDVHYLSESIPDQYMRPFKSNIRRYEPGALRFSDTMTDRGWAARRKRGKSVWSIPMISRLLGRSLKDIPMYHRVVKPAGLEHSAIATVPVPMGEAFLGVSHSRPEVAPFDEEAGLELMRLVFSSFKAGVETLVRLDADRKKLETALDRVRESLALFDARGRELHRSARLEKLLAADPEAGHLDQEMRWIVRSVLDLRRQISNTESSSSDVGAREVQTETARYALRASLVGRGILGLQQAVLVSVERLTPRLPSNTALIDRFDLTPRQAEVALLLARGFSDQEVGERLGISHHTARHHAEWVFTKMGIHTRKALALRLLH